jgi:hypothetical protein
LESRDVFLTIAAALRGGHPTVEPEYPHSSIHKRLVHGFIASEYVFASRQCMSIVRATLMSAIPKAAVAGLEKLQATNAYVLDALPMFAGLDQQYSGTGGGGDAKAAREAAVAAYHKMMADRAGGKEADNG